MSGIADRLRAIGVPAVESGAFTIMPSFPVHLGRYRGSRVDVAVTTLDLAFTPPAGLHVHAPWGADRPNVSKSPLGPDWQYYSRRLPGWAPPNILHPLLAYINRVLSDA